MKTPWISVENRKVLLWQQYPLSTVQPFKKSSKVFWRDQRAETPCRGKASPGQHIALVPGTDEGMHVSTSSQSFPTYCKLPCLGPATVSSLTCILCNIFGHDLSMITLPGHCPTEPGVARAIPVLNTLHLEHRKGMVYGVAQGTMLPEHDRTWRKWLARVSIESFGFFKKKPCKHVFVLIPRVGYEAASDYP